MSFPLSRFRRLRSGSAIRSLVRETTLSMDDFICPVFVTEGEGKREEIGSMPGYSRFSIDELIREVELLVALGIKAVLVFAMVPEDKKDNTGSEALNQNGLMPKTIKALKTNFPDLVVMTDVALDPYSRYGHDGIVRGHEICNDPSIDLLAKMALLHAQAGADWVAPSDMMDGRVAGIRHVLERHHFTQTGIMSYSAKYASCFYGPFRDALNSAPGFGDKKTYQMDPANVREALKEVMTDVDEGADIIMIKPALAYLDVIWRVKELLTVPIAAYQVSGEYSMIKAAAGNGWLNEEEAIIESLTSIKRAGADLIASYFTKDIAKIL